jgi:hypothetical protein
MRKSLLLSAAMSSSARAGCACRLCKKHPGQRRRGLAGLAPVPGYLYMSCSAGGGGMVPLEVVRGQPPLDKRSVGQKYGS